MPGKNLSKIVPEFEEQGCSNGWVSELCNNYNI